MINNGANYDEVCDSTTIVGTNGGPSYYGTYDQCGNVYEWTEGNGPDIVRNNTTFKTKSARGGRYLGRNGDLGLRADYIHYFPPEQKGIAVGFRVCSQGLGEVENNGLLQVNILSNPLKFSNFVLVGDKNNKPDVLQPVIKDKQLEINSGTFGSVAYDYLIQKFPVTVEEYCEFLNSIATNDKYRVLGMGLINGRDPVIEVVNSFFRPLKAKSMKPISHVNWYDAARFVNWLSNGKPKGEQSKTTTEDGTYTLNGVMNPINNTKIVRNKINPNTGLPPTYWIPNEDEWHKAAYYRGGGTDAGYWTFATQSDVSPLSCTKDINHNGSFCSPIPYHEHDIRDINPFNGITKTISFVDKDSNQIILEFSNGILINHSQRRIS